MTRNNETSDNDNDNDNSDDAPEPSAETTSKLTMDVNTENIIEGQLKAAKTKYAPVFAQVSDIQE